MFFLNIKLLQSIDRQLRDANELTVCFVKVLNAENAAAVPET